jgi:hypothetical protein
MHGKEPGEPLLEKLIRSYMARRIFWLEIHREAFMANFSNCRMGSRRHHRKNHARRTSMVYYPGLQKAIRSMKEGMKCEYSFVSGGNTSCSIGELVESLSSHVWWPLLPESLMREETMTMFVCRRNRLRTIWAECVVVVEAMCVQAAAVMTSYSHRDR